MAETQDVHTIAFPLPATDWAGDDIVGHVFQAPTNRQGGGVTILSIEVVNAAATNSGTSFAIQIENWGTAGTGIKATGGTVAAAIGGTADPFAANTPKAGVVSNAFVDADEWIVLRKTEDNSSDPTRGVAYITYQMGA